MTETRNYPTHWPVAARQGGDCYRFIRTQINDCRLRGIEPKRIWITQATADKMHAMWTYVAQAYDLKLPPAVDRVPMSIGMCGGDDFLFEYHDPAANDALLKPAHDNPLPDLD